MQDDSDNKVQDDNDDNCNFVKNTQIDCTSSVSDNLAANLETVIPETQQTPLLPSDLSVTPRRPIKLVYNDNTQSFISFQNIDISKTTGWEGCYYWYPSESKGNNNTHLSARFLIQIFSVTENQRIPIIKIQVMKNRRKRKLLWLVILCLMV